MEDRYEIREKIGQGGMGAVFRGFDSRMNREVAIKRISPEGDAASQKEATDQILREAGALSSLQHPHIVTVYDVGTDAEGPYVVMELLSGKTLDELVERAPLTASDFRELAMQTQEALIAAQELDIVHRDIKPGNLMLTWLPSGKFQVKIVDFGLAALAPDPALQSLEDAESILGSIFFMSPEHFERGRIDVRTDMYAMGCVYYHALTGSYPFTGETGHEVMTAHLQHQVTPLQHLRPDLPRWVCDWVMWHINRQPEDRPENAREALHIFFQNDKNPPPNPPPPPQEPKRPRLVIPGALQPEPPPPAQSIPEPPLTQTAPQPLLPPEGSKPSLHETPVVAASPEPAPPPATPSGSLLTGPLTTAGPARSPLKLKKPKKRGMSNNAKTALAAVLALLVILLAVYLIQRQRQNLDTAHYNELMEMAAAPDATELPVTAAGLELLLDAAANVGASQQRQAIYKALYLARATDGTNVDERIATFATTRQMQPDVREVIIRDVLRRRGNPEILPILMKFAQSTEEAGAAAAALQAARFMATDEDFGQFLEVLQFTASDAIRQAAEEAISEVIGKSAQPQELAARLASAYDGAVSDPVRHALLRLMGRAGGEAAAERVNASLASEELGDQVAAVLALAAWPDGSMFLKLLEFREQTANPQLRSRAFDAAYRFLVTPERQLESDQLGAFWKALAASATQPAEQVRIVDALANRETQPWVTDILRNFTIDGQIDDRVIDRAERALRKHEVND